jgi:hypothetical protein
MTNVTLSVNENDLRKARSLARLNNTSLNEMFREWLKGITQTKDVNIEAKLKSLWEDTDYVVVGRKLTREEMHKR